MQYAPVIFPLSTLMRMGPDLAGSIHYLRTCASLRPSISTERFARPLQFPFSVSVLIRPQQAPWCSQFRRPVLSKIRRSKRFQLQRPRSALFQVDRPGLRGTLSLGDPLPISPSEVRYPFAFHSFSFLVHARGSRRPFCPILLAPRPPLFPLMVHNSLA